MADFEFDQALREGDCAVVDALLSQGYIPLPEQLTPVYETGNVDLFTRLSPYMDLQAGMSAAVEHKQHQLLNHLFLAGADIHLPDDQGCTLLHKVDDATTCQWLLDMGATQTPDASGLTPLWYACYRGNLE
jgi:hypothetical protein